MTTDVETSPPAPAPDRTVAAALAGSAAASAVVPPDEAGPGIDAALAEAARAWRWVVGTEALDLYAVPEASPHWQATCIAAGGALHRARVALAAEGLQAHVTLLPEPSDRGLDRSRGLVDRGRRGAPVTPHLARLVVTGTIEVTDEARDLYAATDQTAWFPRRPRRPAPPPAPQPRTAEGSIGASAAGSIGASAEGSAAASAAGSTGVAAVGSAGVTGVGPAGAAGASAHVPAGATADVPTGTSADVPANTSADAATGPRRPLPSGRAVARELVKAARAEGVRLRLIRDGDEYIGVMHGPDTGEAWLRAGMACSAVRLLARRLGLRTVTAIASDNHLPPVPASPARPDRPPRSGRRRIGDREGWLNVGIGTPYLRLRLAPIPADPNGSD